MEIQNRLSDAEAHALLDQLFPLGVAGPDVLAELAPAGWDQSPLMIFRRFRACGTDWVYHFPRLHLVDLGGLQEQQEPRGPYSPNEALAAERAAAARDAGITHTRAELDVANDRAREAALDRRPPTTVIAYRSVFGRNPRGWPPTS